MKPLTSFMAVVLGCAVLALCIAFPAVGQTGYTHFSFTSRPHLPFPVAAVRPAIAGQVAALDVMPSAGAVEHQDNGFSWFDACDADVLNASGAVPVTCARLGIRSWGAEIGTRSFDGAPAKPVFIVINRQIVGRFDQSGLTVYGVVKAQSFAN